MDMWRSFGNQRICIHYLVFRCYGPGLKSTGFSDSYWPRADRKDAVYFFVDVHDVLDTAEVYTGLLAQIKVRGFLTRYSVPGCDGGGAR